jgi:methyltransferase OMS1, mitochondrial
MLQCAKVKMKQLKDPTRFATMQVDAAKLSAHFPNQCFDTVVDTFGLCSYDDPVRVLKEMATVCKSEGKILLLERGRSRAWESLSRYLDKHAERHAKNWGSVWNRDIDQIVQDAGLRIDTKDTWHFGTTYYLVCRPAKDINGTLVSSTSSFTDNSK